MPRKMIAGRTRRVNSSFFRCRNCSTSTKKLEFSSNCDVLKTYTFSVVVGNGVPVSLKFSEVSLTSCARRDNDVTSKVAVVTFVLLTSVVMAVANDEDE